VPEPEKPGLSEQILLKDSYNGEISSLKKIAGGKAVFMEISASWCIACREMHPVTQKLYEIFKGKAFFVRIMLSKGIEETETPPFPVMEIERSPGNLSIQSSQILPRIIIIDSSGELTADISGQYPALYYYGILSEL